MNMSDWIRQQAGRGSPPQADPGPEPISEVRVQELSEVLGLTRDEAIERLTPASPTPRTAHAGAGTGTAPVQQVSVSQKMNQLIRKLSGR